METVELHPAFMWDCPECGREHFERAVVVELSEEEEAVMREENGIESWESGEWLDSPKEVECPECGITFEARHMGDEEF